VSDPAGVSAAAAGRDALARLLAAVPAAQLAAAARDMFAFLPLPPGFSWEDRRAVVDRLASLDPPTTGVPTLVLFATRLSREVGQLESIGISRWVDAAGRAAGMSENDLRWLFVRSQPGDRSPDRPTVSSPKIYDTDKTVIVQPSEDRDLPNRSATADLPKASLERSDAVRIWGGVPIRNPDFTGRESLLLILQRSLEARSTASAESARPSWPSSSPTGFKIVTIWCGGSRPSSRRSCCSRWPILAVNSGCRARRS
jgi:hypothetical protein